MSLRDTGAQHGSVYSFVTWGPMVAYVELYGPTGELQQIKLLDLSDPTHQVRVLEDGSESGRHVTSPATNGETVAWVSFKPRRAGGFEWRIVAYDVASGATRTLVEGVNESRKGPDGVPHIAIDGDLIAYETQAPLPGKPNAQAIHVASMTTLREFWTITTDLPLWDLGVSEGSVLYTVGRGIEDGQIVGTTTWLAKADGTSVDFGQNGWEVKVDGDLLVWVQRADDVTGDSAKQFQIVMSATVNDPVARLVSHPYEQPGCPPTCAIVGARWPAAGDGLVAWQESDPSYDYLVAWDPSTDRRVRLPLHGDGYVNQIGGGWLVSVTTLLDDPDAGSKFVGMRVEDILAAINN